ncbi:MAG: tRNA lysidine(34) synthetase TilS [Candidatus Paracaedibacter sp.]
MSTLTPLEFSHLMASFGSFEPPPTLAIATSGGPDSLALALLAHQWAINQGGKAFAITVDHLLREDSTAEAHQVKAWLETRGIEHHILTWQRDDKNEPLQTAIQATAREARYQMLGQWCKDHGIKHLLTAHHAQDQLETFMIRLAKGSGLKGLTSTQGEVLTNFGRILRPLLSLDANRLKATLKAFNQPFLLDPSNENEDFARVRWRQLLPSLSAEGLTPMTIQETLARLNHAQRLVDQHISDLLHEHVSLSFYGYATLKKEALKESPEAFEEMLKRILATIGTRDYPVRRQAIHRAIEAMNAGQSFTLGGCQIIHKTNEFWIVREPAAVGENIPVKQPGIYLWDHRFRVDVSEGVPCRIAALREGGIQKLGAEAKQSVEHIPYIVMQTLPALWQEEKLLELSSAYTFTPHFPLIY